MPQGSLFASMIRTGIYSLASRRSGSAVGRQLHAFSQVPRSAGAFSDWFQPLKIKSFINNVTATPLEKIEEPLKGFSWEFDKIKSADNRVLQEQLQNKCTENKELEEKVLQLEQQLTSVSSDNKPSSSENCVHDEYTEELRKKVQLQDKPAFIFCVEDRALFCKDCDEPIHSANSRAANHQRFLATGIRVALGSSCSKENAKSDVEPKPPPKSSSQQIGAKTTPLLVPGITSPSWGVDDLLQFSDYSSPDKQKEHIEFNELEWLSDISLFGEQVPEALAAAEVPQLPTSQPSHMMSFRAAKSYAPHKKPRIEIPDDDEEFFTVPDLG